MGAGKEWYLRNFVEALLGAKDVVLAPALLLKRVDAVTISGFISLYDLGKIIDDLPCGLARLNDSLSILEKTLALFDISTELRFPPPERGANSANGHLSVSRADLAVFLLKLEAYGGPINPESLALSVAEEALKKDQISSSELDCVLYSRGKLSFPPFEMGFGMGAVPADPHTFETPTEREVYVDDRPKQYWVRIRAKPIRPLTLSTA